MYAVIVTGGKQYRVKPGDVLRVEKLIGAVGENVTFPEVLMLSGETGATFGKPNVEGASVTAKIVEQDRAKKVRIFKRRRRKGYKLKKGHRQSFTGIAIQTIEGA